MTVLRSLLFLLAMALAPLQPAWAIGMPVMQMTSAATHANPVETGGTSAADCCKDGGHQNPGCQSVPALPDIAHVTLLAPDARATDPAPIQDDRNGRNPDQPLRPPIPA